MRKFFLKLLILSFLFQASPLLNHASFAQQGKTLKVATKLIPPFVFKEKDELTGFSIELWEAIAKQMNREFVWVEKPTLPDVLAEVKAKKADLAIAAISITAEREALFDFSQPMFDAGLQIMVSANKASEASPIKSLYNFMTSKTFKEMLYLLLGLVLIPIPFLLFFERKNENLITGGFFNRLLDALWWSSSTIGAQSGGAPASHFGRLLAVIWMFTSIIFVSFFTANFAAGLTVKQLESSINGPQDLHGKKVAVIKGTTGQAFMKTIDKAELIEFTKVEDAYKAIIEEKALAFVYDAPVLLYYVSNEGKGKLQVVGSIFKPENYGILFNSGNALRKDVNAAILKLRENGDYAKLYKKWFSAGGSDAEE